MDTFLPLPLFLTLMFFSIFYQLQAFFRELKKRLDSFKEMEIITIKSLVFFLYLMFSTGMVSCKTFTLVICIDNAAQFKCMLPINRL